MAGATPSRRWRGAGSSYSNYNECIGDGDGWCSCSRYIQSFSNTGLSLLVVTKCLFFQDVEVVAFFFGKSDGRFLVSNDEEISSSGGK